MDENDKRLKRNALHEKWKKNHPEQVKILDKRYREKNKDKIKAARYKQRHDVIDYYSNGTMKCSCCGEDDYNSLTIDHINNDGAKHRKEMTHRSIAQWLVTNNFPEGFQVLCYNCNCTKEYNGSMEHRRNKYSANTK